MTKAQIKKRILQAIPLLNDKYRPAFKGPHNRRWDAAQCRVYGSGYYLQWDKGETRNGSVSLHCIPKEDKQALPGDSSSKTRRPSSLSGR